MTGLWVLAMLAAQEVEPSAVDAAIRKGVGFLKSAEAADSDELVLWTLVHAGVSEKDAMFQALLQKMLRSPLERTYRVSLQAMILEEIDRVKHQGRIAACAQFLVDNQCANGQWSYGQPTPFAEDVPTSGPVRKDIVTSGVREFGPAVSRQKPKVVRTIPIQKRQEGPADGDNSNSQYAALGLRACHDSGIVIPKDVLLLGARWWKESQLPEKDKGASGAARGWYYYGKDHANATAYLSMTAGAAGSLAIYDHILKLDGKKDPAIRSGLTWMAGNFSVTENAGYPDAPGPRAFHYYCLYAIERAAILTGTTRIGSHDWYSEGAKFLLGAQREDGSWDGAAESRPVWDTCFAILFLRRATRPLVDVPSVDRFNPK